MNRKPIWLITVLAAAATLAAACGSTGGGSTSKGTVVIAGFDFAESSILGQLYGQSLAHDGYTVNYKARLGKREVVAPALKAGQIDMYPGYAATDLEYYNGGIGEASGDVTARLAGALVPVLEVGGRVAGVQVDLPALESGCHHLATTQPRLVVDRIAVVRELLAVDLAEDRALREIKAGDGQGAFAGRPAA